MPTTESRGLRRYDAAKQVKGRKRHLVVNTLGLPLRVAVQATDLQDRDGQPDDLPRLRVIWGEGGDQGPKLGDWGQGTWQLCMVRRDPAADGFEVLPKR